MKEATLENATSHFSYMHQIIAHRLLLSRADYPSFGNSNFSYFQPEKSTIFDHYAVIEMDSRSASLENGSAKGYTWEEVKQKAHTAARPRK